MATKQALVLEVTAKLDPRVVAEASNGGVMAVVELDRKGPSGRNCYAVVYDPGFVDPNQRKGAMVAGDKTGKRYERSGGARLQRGRGRFATGVDCGTHSTRLVVMQNDRDAVAAPETHVDTTGLW